MTEPSDIGIIADIVGLANEVFHVYHRAEIKAPKRARLFMLGNLWELSTVVGV
jgi:hypothetical protein